MVGFLLTSVSKRDAMGRRPRRRVFAIEGLKAWGKEIAKPLDCMVLPLHGFFFLTGEQALRGGAFLT